MYYNYYIIVLKEIWWYSKPIYEEFEGNFGDISNCKTYDELPENAKNYAERIEELTETKVKFIGTGPSRENIIIR